MTEAAPTSLSPAQAWRLASLLQARRLQPFAWGMRDCAMLPFDAALAITGQDPAADLRGAYFSAPQAWRLLRNMGGMRGMAAARFGAEVPLDELAATPPDVAVVLFSADVCTHSRLFGGALGIRWLGHCIGQGPAGLVELPASAVQACWRVA